MSKPPRRFPPPWTVEETQPCFIVRDANKQALAFVYCEDEPGRRAAASLLTRDEGAIIFKHACALGCEGIVSKRLGSRYRAGRKNPAAPDETGPHRRVVTKKKPRDFRPRARLLSPPNRSTAEPIEAIDEFGGDELGRFLRVEH
jgi:hypothetical protein